MSATRRARPAGLPHRRCPFGQWPRAQQDVCPRSAPGLVAVASEREDIVTNRTPDRCRRLHRDVFGAASTTRSRQSPGPAARAGRWRGQALGSRSASLAHAPQGPDPRQRSSLLQVVDDRRRDMAEEGHFREPGVVGGLQPAPTADSVPVPAPGGSRVARTPCSRSLSRSRPPARPTSACLVPASDGRVRPATEPATLRRCAHRPPPAAIIAGGAGPTRSRRGACELHVHHRGELPRRCRRGCRRSAVPAFATSRWRRPSRSTSCSNRP